MNAEEMSYEQLEQLAALKRAQMAARGDAPSSEPQPNRKYVTVDGVSLAIDKRKLTSWRAFELVSAIDAKDASEFEKMANAFELVEFIAGMGKREVLDCLDGELTDIRKVSEFVIHVIQAAYPKN